MKMLEERVVLAMCGTLLVACPSGESLRIAIPEEQTDVYVQDGTRKLDVLWIVDDHLSMGAPLAKLQASASSFLESLVSNEVDFQIGVISGRKPVLKQYSGPPVSGCAECRILSKSVPCDLDGTNGPPCDSIHVLTDLLDVDMRGFEPALAFEHSAAALGLVPHSGLGGPFVAEAPAENIGFLREDAALMLIFVSNRDEGLSSSGPPVHYFARLFAHLKGGSSAGVTAAAVVGWPVAAQVDFDVVPAADLCSVLYSQYARSPVEDDPSLPLALSIMQRRVGCFDVPAQGALASPAMLGSRYIELACRMGGAVANICSEDYAPSLRRLALRAVNLLRSFELQRASEIHRGPDCILFTQDDTNLDCDHNGSTGDAIDGPICVYATDSDAPLRPVPRDPELGWQWNDAAGAVEFAGDFVPRPGHDLQIRYRLYRGTEPCR